MQAVREATISNDVQVVTEGEKKKEKKKNLQQQVEVNVYHL